MSKEKTIIFLKEQEIRRTWHQDAWWFAVIDVVVILTDSVNPADYRKNQKLTYVII